MLRSVVDVARAIFEAQASSIFLLDEERDELVFAAVSGQGEDFLVGRRFPASRGIAGWVVRSRQPLTVDDVSSRRDFAGDIAEATRYVPTALMAAPLLCGERVLGVLEVLDRNPAMRTSLAGMDLLALFAGQAALALELTEHHERAAAPRVPADLAAALGGLPAERSAAGHRLLDALRDVLA
ncbi:GAF domain-containing protein [Streptomyces sp. TRM 70351]|nr:GAF domain-containing protein [Streptomyces sp. TRM 70351]MEE1928288.1 GAF domain-containing protein [Streptomyces sp. TRM 70351]